MSRRLAACLALLCAVLPCAAAGCASFEPSRRPDRTARVSTPEGYTDPARPSGQVAEECGDPGASLRPVGPAARPDGLPEGPTLAAIRQRGRLLVGASQTAMLLNRRDLVTGVMDGFETDIAMRIAGRIFGARLPPGDPRVQFVTVPTGSRLYGLDTRPNRAERDKDPAKRAIPVVDMVIADVAITCARVRLHGVRYSTPYMAVNKGLIVRRGAETAAVKGPDDLGRKKVCAGSGTVSVDRVIQERERQIAQGRVPWDVVSTSDTTECLPLLQRGIVDAVSTDDVVLAGFAHQDPGTRVLDYRDPDVDESGVAMSGEHEDLVRLVNGVLDEMRASGDLQNLYDQWFAAAIGSRPVPAARYLD